MLQLKYIFTTLCLLFTLNSISLAQSNEFEAIESEKIAYISKSLKLTPHEAQRFFPIYNMYNKELWDLKMEKRKHKQQDVISYDAKEVEIKKQYRAEFTKVIGTTRASQFFQVVEDFHDILRERIKNRHGSNRK